MAASLVLALLLQGAGASTPAPPKEPVRLTCALALAQAPDRLATLACQGDEQIKKADAAAKQSTERREAMQAAVDLFTKAAAAATTGPLTGAALEAVARLLDTAYLNDLPKLEQTLRELTDVKPGDLDVLFRLSKAEEDQQRIDEAESTLLAARRLQPSSTDAYKRLAQFYARRVAALSAAAQANSATANPVVPGERDKDGFYRVGASIKAPTRREGGPAYPDAARAAGVSGVVQLEIFIDQTGTVGGARVTQSIPLLDAAAIETVKRWHYAPTIVNGHAVPVKMIVPVTFNLPRQ